MIGPMVISCSSAEISIFIISRTLRCVDYPILVSMSFIQKVSNLIMSLNFVILTLSIGFLYIDSIPLEGYDIAIILGVM